MLHLSHGNKKLVPNDKVKFLIWSLPPISTCPFATPMCKKFCYAMKAFKAYPNARNAWEDNFKESQNRFFAQEMILAIAKELDRPSVKKAKTLVVRIHESGDFYSKEYAKAWLKVAWYFMGYAPNKVKFMAYTKSIEFFKDERIPENMAVRFSLWDDTEPTQKALAEEMGLPIYTAVDKFTTEPKAERCGCVDCGKCCKCWSALKMLKCEIH